MMNRLFVASLTIFCLLSVMPYPCEAQQDSVIYACVKSDGTMRIVPAPDSCRRSEALLSWNAKGPPGPSLPPWLGFEVNCDQSESINDALAHQSESITISVRGTCSEEVFINRDHVILTAINPNNPPTLTHEGTPLFVSGARDVSLSNLKITGSPSYVGVIASNSQVTLESCEIWNKSIGVEMGGLSAVDIRNSQIHDNGGGISIGAGGVLTIYDTHVDGNNSTGIGVTASTLHTVRSTISNNGLGIELGHGAAVILEHSDVSWNSPGEGIGAGGSSVNLTESTLTYNAGAGIWGESTFVLLGGGNTISNNSGGGIALSAGSSLAYRAYTGANVIKDNEGCGLTMIVSSFAIGKGITIEETGSCAISCDTDAAICDPTYVKGAIGGCGDKCPTQQP